MDDLKQNKKEQGKDIIETNLNPKQARKKNKTKDFKHYLRVIVHALFDMIRGNTEQLILVVAELFIVTKYSKKKKTCATFLFHLIVQVCGN